MFVEAGNCSTSVVPQVGELSHFVLARKRETRLQHVLNRVGGLEVKGAAQRATVQTNLCRAEQIVTLDATSC
jgi:hypothetical protein